MGEGPSWGTAACRRVSGQTSCLSAGALEVRLGFGVPLRGPRAEAASTWWEAQWGAQRLQGYPPRLQRKAFVSFLPTAPKLLPEESRGLCRARGRNSCLSQPPAGAEISGEQAAALCLTPAGPKLLPLLFRSLTGGIRSVVGRGARGTGAGSGTSRPVPLLSWDWPWAPPFPYLVRSRAAGSAELRALGALQSSVGSRQSLGKGAPGMQGPGLLGKPGL